MLTGGKESQNVKAKETKLIAYDVLLLNQIFGGLPLKYTKLSNKNTNIEFSKPLQLFAYVYITCLTTLSCWGLNYDYTRYVAGEPLMMSNTFTTITMFVDITFLNFMAMAVIVTASRKYSKLIEMCRVLEKVDKSLKQSLDMPATRLKVLVMFVLTTAVLICTMYLQLLTKSLEIIYLHKICMYYTQIAMYILFTFVTESLTMRFKQVNEKIQQEVVRLNMRLMIKDLNLSNIISGYERSTADRVYILVDSYVQLYKALQLANSFYKSQLFVTVCFLFVQSTLSLYNFFASIWSVRKVIKELDLFIEGLLALAHTSYLFLLVWPTKTLKREGKKTAPLVCQLLSKDLNDTELRDQLETFLLQLCHYKVEFSALGFFQMNSNLLPLIASSVTTYLVILIQLKLNDQ